MLTNLYLQLSMVGTMMVMAPPLLPRMPGIPGPQEKPPAEGGSEQVGSKAAVPPGAQLPSNPAEAAPPAGEATQEAATGPQAGDPPTIPA